MKVERNLSSESFFLLVTYSHFKQVRVLENIADVACARLKLHIKEASYSCSRIHQEKNNELNGHANLPKASLVETHVYVCLIWHVQNDFDKASVSL